VYSSYVAVVHLRRIDAGKALTYQNAMSSMRSENEMFGTAPVDGSKTNPFRRTSDNCSFCEEVIGTDAIGLPLVRKFFNEFGHKSRVLFENEYFFVVPSLGALVPGHVLVLPKAHYYSVGEIPEAELHSFEALVRHTRGLISRVYGSCAEFEHGCVEGGSKAGACIDHAHLHLLPLARDLQSMIDAKFGSGCEIHAFSELKGFVRKRIPYLYYRNPSGTAKAYEAQQVPSQFFRQLVFATGDSTRSWDWKRDIRTDLVVQTYDALLTGFMEAEG
jgi:diadenosine tetraphosphate (Ap4A) HIT family hydrolase